jgi:hypothetical protein
VRPEVILAPASCWSPTLDSGGRALPTSSTTFSERVPSAKAWRGGGCRYSLGARSRSLSHAGPPPRLDPRPLPGLAGGDSDPTVASRPGSAGSHGWGAGRARAGSGEPLVWRDARRFRQSGPRAHHEGRILATIAARDLSGPIHMTHSVPRERNRPPTTAWKRTEREIRLPAEAGPSSAPSFNRDRPDRDDLPSHRRFSWPQVYA